MEVTSCRVDYTIIHNSGGYHGHQLKDRFGGLTIGSLMGWNYVHTSYPYLDHFAVHDTEQLLTFFKRHFGYRKVYKLEGPYWDGFSSHNAFRSYVNKYVPVGEAQEKTLVVISMASRVFPHQTISWHREGIIEKDIFTQLRTQISHRYWKRHRYDQLIDRETPKVAIHISRGVDYNPEKFPEHFSDSYNVRYMFSLEYFDAIIRQLQEEYPQCELNIFTEHHNSSEISSHFGEASGVRLHIGPNRKQKSNELVHQIFRSFVESDILVACNSSFSAMCAYFRQGRPTIYHPHRHLDDLPQADCIPTQIDGTFKVKLLKDCLAKFS